MKKIDPRDQALANQVRQTILTSTKADLDSRKTRLAEVEAERGRLLEETRPANMRLADLQDERVRLQREINLLEKVVKSDGRKSVEEVAEPTPSGCAG